MESNTNIYTVSRLNREMRELIEESFPLIWLEGEISNLSQPSSGHIYFSLKDELAQVRGAMFQSRKRLLTFKPENGMKVLVQAQISLYEPRGDYQLIIYHMEPAGDGVLRLKFEQLKKQLEQEGLFAKQHKKTPARFPKCLGIITSPTAAALQDVISILKRRAPNIPLIIYPTQVQGTAAAKQIVKAIEIANQHNKCDTLIVTRGGGSLEDIWPFNEEAVARSIYASKIPIISGVGHETDFTITDFTADLRAPTPSAAAELASPNKEEWLAIVEHKALKLINAINNKISHNKLVLEHLIKRLQHPGKRLQNYAQHLDHCEQRLNLAIRNLIKQKTSKLINLSRTLETISPIATLNRGFAIATRKKDNKIITNTKQIKIGDKINTRLAKGTLECEILDIFAEKP